LRDAISELPLQQVRLLVLVWLEEAVVVVALVVPVFA
jgi:hypothetical protein